MIIVMKPDAAKKDIENVLKTIKDMKLRPHVSKGKERTLIGAIGDERSLANIPLTTFAGVEKVLPILSPYKVVSREFKKENTLIRINGVTIGGRRIVIMAGPCSIEGREMLMQIGKYVKSSGASVLRGGAYKPRTSPYSFQGMGREGLELLKEAKHVLKMPVVTEVMDTRDIGLITDYADIFQVGARNMQNFSLLKELGSTNRPILLKRGLSATVKELLMSAEYIASKGNDKIILCERGIRTFETETRNTLDLNAIPVLKKLTHLPVIVDPSHGTGRRDIVATMSLAAIAAGADGIIVEVHQQPEKALSDGEQSLRPDEFKRMVRDIDRVAKAIGRTI
ncbi:MAG: 3-deoxy-7-phosphoheptulonate synthase [Deltaproteobacteria bacterium]|nr:3-deoxy-7-phosphoheptulonate synthase [Deltaproteobacteria bacterium]